MVSTVTGAGGFILMAEPSKLVEKAIGRLNAAWNSVKSELFLASIASSYTHYVTITAHD